MNISFIDDKVRAILFETQKDRKVFRDLLEHARHDLKLFACSTTAIQACKAMLKQFDEEL